MRGIAQRVQQTAIVALAPTPKLSLVQRLTRRVLDFLSSTWVLRFMSAVLRRIAPVLVVGKRVLVVRHADVIDVLSRDQEFTISEINGAKTIRDNGPFVLSMDRSPQHDREKDFLNAVMQREDAERVRALVARESAVCLERVHAAGRLDLVHDLTRVVPLRVIETYFGVPAPAPAAMMGWLRALFHDLFLNQSDEPEVIARAVAAFGELRRHLEAVIARRRAEAEAGDVTPPSDVLGRMLALQRQDAYRAWLDDDAICRNVSGLIIGALETTSKAVILVIDELFRRPSALREATAAAVAGDVERVRGYAFEALRFNPFVPVLVRHCRAETELGGRKVPAGTLVYAGTLSAMFDGSTVERPAEFRADRSLEYLHFGYGLHRCQGRLVNNVQVPELVMHILRLKGLRRASGSSAKVVYDGPFPDRFIVEFDPI